MRAVVPQGGDEPAVGAQGVDVVPVAGEVETGAARAQVGRRELAEAAVADGEQARADPDRDRRADPRLGSVTGVGRRPAPWVLGEGPSDEFAVLPGRVEGPAVAAEHETANASRVRRPSARV